MPQIMRSFNVNKDKPDPRDYLFSSLNIKPSARMFYPAQVDLRPVMPTVQDQGNLGSCTANAIASAFQYDLYKQRLAQFSPSRLFVYYNERVLIGTVNEDSGAYIRDGIKTLNTNGVCKEPTWPYQISKFAVKPSDLAYSEATKSKARAYYRVNVDATSLKSAVASGFPVIIGFAVYASFMSRAVAKSGKMPMPKPTDYLLGGHAVLIVGFKESTREFIVRNSWGTGWGERGYFYMPYDYARPDLMADCWVVTSVVSPK